MRTFHVRSERGHSRRGLAQRRRGSLGAGTMTSFLGGKDDEATIPGGEVFLPHSATRQWREGRLFWARSFRAGTFPLGTSLFPPRPPHPRLESHGQASSPFRAPGAAVLPVTPTAQRLEGTLPLPFSSRSHALHHVAQHSLPGQRAQPREISDWSATRDFG